MSLLTSCGKPHCTHAVVAAAADTISSNGARPKCQVSVAACGTLRPSPLRPCLGLVDRVCCCLSFINHIGLRAWPDHLMFLRGSYMAAAAAISSAGPDGATQGPVENPKP